MIRYEDALIYEINAHIVRSLEENLYRTHIGKFELYDAQGRFSAGKSTNGRLRVFDTVKCYDLRCELTPQDIIPGLGQNPERMILRYQTDVARKRNEHLFEITVVYVPPKGVVRAADEVGFEMIRRNVLYDKQQRGNFSKETFEWIFEAL